MRNENGRVTGYGDVDIAGRDAGSYVSEANQLLRDRLKLPTGYSIAWSGQYEVMQRVKGRLKLMVPVTLFLICLLLYFNTGSIPKTIIVLLAVPFFAVGAAWFLLCAGFHISLAVLVGLVALMWIDTLTGASMPP